MSKKTKSERIKPLQRIAEHHEQQTAIILGSSRKALGECEQRLGDLIKFRGDYTQQILEAGKNGINGSRLQALYQFVNQLDMAIEQQKHNILLAQHDCDQHTLKWQQQHQETTILSKTVSRFEDRERLVGQKLEQKMLDEHNQQRVQFNKDQHKIT